MRVGGGMLVLLGIALVTGLWSRWAAWLQGLLTGTDPFIPAV
jgi:cytochrome c-type biogenesis protein